MTFDRVITLVAPGGDELAALPRDFLLCTRDSHTVAKLLDKVRPANVAHAWSLWNGYRERDGCALRRWTERAGAEWHVVHSGGHAQPEDPARPVVAVAAKEMVWVHTEWVGGPGGGASDGLTMPRRRPARPRRSPRGPRS